MRIANGLSLLPRLATNSRTEKFAVIWLATAMTTHTSGRQHGTEGTTQWQLPNDFYTVGWIYPSFHEYVAAQTFVDDRNEGSEYVPENYNRAEPLLYSPYGTGNVPQSFQLCSPLSESTNTLSPRDKFEIPGAQTSYLENPLSESSLLGSHRDDSTSAHFMLRRPGDALAFQTSISTVPMFSPRHSKTNCEASSTQLLTKQHDTEKRGIGGQNLRKTCSAILCSPPAIILLFFVIGVGSAVGHHLYYRSLNGREVSSEQEQQWAIRIGTGLAFSAKVALVSSIVLAYTQRLWVTVKKRSWTLQNLDDAFSLPTSPLSFFSVPLLRKGKVLYLLAICIWTIPFVALVTPATLSVRAGVLSTTEPASVPIPLWLNETTNDTSYWAHWGGAGYQAGPSVSLSHLVFTAATSMSIIPSTAPFLNASFTLEFPGPSLRCTNVSTVIAADATMGRLWNRIMYENTHHTIIYKANTTEREGLYNHIFISVGGFDRGSHYSCSLYNATYKVRFTFRDGVQSTIFDRPTIPPSAAPLQIKGFYWTDFAPSELAYMSMFQAVTRRLLVARLSIGSTGILNGDDTSGILLTSVAACDEFPSISSDALLVNQTEPWMCPSGSVARAVEDLWHNVTLSTLSSRVFGRKRTSVQAEVEMTRNFYSYEAVLLWQAYSVAIVAALVCVVVGMHSYVANGYSASNSFSTILLATRNPDLDCLLSGKDAARARLRYGVVAKSADGEGLDHAAFGLVQTVEPSGRGDNKS
ncbi:hypothetical protein MCOR27_002085 [Pyricularia oryzae]|uniref:Transmembrane protein n=1 Tax=Pyricularia grisea TaxID=148305 RepID=A0ABQ8NZY7_PYRGI|nr:hypothetical protein MCOR19_000056 [Pyricularia oryzae]KAI6303282.1 hypothetical protein MCOR33_001545 [Pyricularia grisea]KAI6285798.1 hypothetical protein MCOR27_002085 [Pyricularia oryzae]KAI6322992.1 hypothetical protein MCOR34_002073 [Pyricularia oryzae]KAI6336623.1 hypothetical protein MCOR29_000008 [Pyricularia oryzae]